MTLNVPTPEHMTDGDLTIFRDSVVHFLDRHAPPARIEQWRHDKVVARALWTRAGEASLLGLSTDADHGGAGGDFRHEVVLMEEVARRGLDGWGVTLHNAIVMPYISHYGTAEQKARWLPQLASGARVGAIAMTEPGAGSDLQGVRTTARRRGEGYVLNGSKTFITNGQTAELVIVVAKTDPSRGAKGISLFVVETEAATGFERGRNLDKIGLEAADTSELFFNDVALPATALLGGEEGRGFVQLMEQLPQERLIIAVQAMAMIERALAVTLDYVRQRHAFGRPVIDNQVVAFRLAECKTEATVAKVFVNHCVGQHLAGRLDAATASMAKYWVTELQGRIIDTCLQLHGGYGYMDEYPIARMFKDARVARIYGGTNEIMKLLIARTL
ncbi:Acyl-CoA dehydrogenase [Rhodovastum atsumiense]|uniref:Acyl-[acyl-carrier-protein] dehydrogenase MbtN n=1 Tax=Rhodovastum atsumiense TaxID=504468 RepID=A0A5M6J0U7_9PROT|nr:acyl-CoA dehydrogenase family protein [Rhodovastum atsumiense]KAA5614131.1 acyl-CoA dehydrogenase [Rhodovastum atsumiense]CAH2598980.1 Acyl-CoA dehydrogenase [Rhodovastum atsumiense]